jgi:hypothetical protein
MRTAGKLASAAALVLGLGTSAMPVAAAAPAQPAAKKCVEYAYGSPGNEHYTLYVTKDSCNRKIRAAAVVQLFCMIPPYPVDHEYGRPRTTPGSSTVDAGLCPKTWKLWGYDVWQPVRFRKDTRKKFYYFKYEWVWFKLGCCDHISDGQRG